MAGVRIKIKKIDCFERIAGRNQLCAVPGVGCRVAGKGANLRDSAFA